MECILSDFLLCIHISCTHLQSRESAGVRVSGAHTHSTPQPAFSANKISQASSQASVHAPFRFLPPLALPVRKIMLVSCPIRRQQGCFQSVTLGNGASMSPRPGLLVHTHQGLWRARLQKESWGSRSLPFLCGSISRQPSDHSMYRGTVPPLATALQPLSH